MSSCMAARRRHLQPSPFRHWELLQTKSKPFRGNCMYDFSFSTAASLMEAHPKQVMQLKRVWTNALMMSALSYRKNAFLQCVSIIVSLPQHSNPWTFRFPIHTEWFGFRLDELQTKSVGCVHIGEFCLVSAHTSAGKTVVAEYAIRQSLLRGKRIIYTSP